MVTLRDVRAVLDELDELVVLFKLLSLRRHLACLGSKFSLSDSEFELELEIIFLFLDLLGEIVL